VATRESEEMEQGMLDVGQTLDRVATRTARSMLGWSARHAHPSRRGWIVALRHELHEVEGGWARLALAMSGLRLAYLAAVPSEHVARNEAPESWRIAAGGMLLGLLAWIAFATRVPDLERLPAEVLFCFLMLYFYTVGFLSGRRTGQTSKGAWAGVIAGLAFGVAVCAHMTVVSFAEGTRTTIMYGGPNQVAIAWSGVVFFIIVGAICGSLGAQLAIRERRRLRRAEHRPPS
jgi:hypothetical protein